jgi:soluble cytochrome b562
MDPEINPDLEMDEDAAIEQILGENPRARELREMREALETRRTTYQRSLAQAKDPKEIREIKHKLDELKTQIDVIRQEEGISTFVEATVRGALHRPARYDEDEP